MSTAPARSGWNRRIARGLVRAVAVLLVWNLSATLAVAQSAIPVPNYDAKEWKEMGATPPAYPSPATLVKFPTNWTTSEILVDGSTLVVGEDAVVRYVLVVKSAGGAENVTFEGLRCDTGQRRIYAFGRRDRTWSLARASDWKPIDDSRINRHHFEFWRDVFCDGKMSEPREVIVRNLIKGGRERATSTPSD